MTNFVRRMRERGLPLEPSSDNPHEIARAQWDQLREYATKVAQIATEVDDTNKTLMAENESLRREVQRLADQVAQISREHRATTAYAESIRTRLASIAEQINVATSESLQYASQAIRAQPETKEAPEEIPEVVPLAQRIAKINPTGTMLPANAWPSHE